MGENIRNNLGAYLKWTIVVLIILLVVLGIFFYHEYSQLRKAQIANDIHRGVPLTADDVDIVRPWMTFDYVNRIFNVSSTYLKNDLSITDPAYPHTTLSSYAQYSHIDPTLLTTQVEGALDNYLTGSSTN